MPGDIYCCVEHTTRSSHWNGHDPEAVQEAVAAGAAAIIAAADSPLPEGLVPDGVPVVYADDVDELATRLAAVLYGTTQGVSAVGLVGLCTSAGACISILSAQASQAVAEHTALC
jgi:hypothetical protein